MYREKPHPQKGIAHFCHFVVGQTVSIYRIRPSPSSMAPGKFGKGIFGEL